MSEPEKETTVIGSDTHITGEMTFKKNARIVGSFEGKVKGEGDLRVADNATCKAEVESNSITVDGKVEGNLIARDKLQLNAKGVIKGDIVAGKMVMTEGASFFGQCAVGADAVKNNGAPKPAGTPASAPPPATEFGKAKKPGEMGAGA
ncbi:MAG: bactofilin family protein [Planctomycetota bacterium]|jgi:cytoskeletal protein CcmA (bactofilin family)